jgi:hypothetical protein
MLASASSAGQDGTARSVTLSGNTVGSQYFAKITGADTTPRTLRPLARH